MGRHREPDSRSVFSQIFPPLFGLLGLAGSGCTVMATRPIQEMADTSAAIRAAREVQADTLAPGLFRQSSEWFQKAKNEYKLKNFAAAKEAADRSKYFAEVAEFQALRNSGVRSDVNIAEPVVDTNVLPGQGTLPSIDPEPQAPVQSTPYPFPSPTGTPFTEYDKRKASEDEAARKKAEQEQKAAQPQPPPLFPYPILGAPQTPVTSPQNPTP